MNEIIEKVKELKKELDSLPEVKNYLDLKEKLDSNKELLELKENIARLKSKQKDKEAGNLLEIYNSHPLVVNFNQAREELNSILEVIKNILSD